MSTHPAKVKKHRKTLKNVEHPQKIDQTYTKIHVRVSPLGAPELAQGRARVPEPEVGPPGHKPKTTEADESRRNIDDDEEAGNFPS